MLEKKSISVDYRSVFKTENGKNVLNDLNKFCFGSRSYIDTTKKMTVNDAGGVVSVSSVDPLELARFEGRREVLLYIMRQTKMNNIDTIDQFLDDEMEDF